MSSNLVVTVGLPRSGKTTLCRNVYEPQGYVRICPDDFRLAIHGKSFLPSAEPFVWAAVYAAVDALLLAGKKVVVDACNGTAKRREPWASRGASFILMGTSSAECLSRAFHQGDEDILPVIERMAKECDWPEAITGGQLCTKCGIGRDTDGDGNCAVCGPRMMVDFYSGDLEYLRVSDGPVISGLEKFEITFAKNQPQYIPLRALVSRDNWHRVLSKWSLSDHHRKKIAAGADIYLELATFLDKDGQPNRLQPVRMAIGKNPDAEHFRQEYNLQATPVVDEAAVKAHEKA